MSWEMGPGVAEFPDGVRVRGRGLKRDASPDPRPQWGLYLLARSPAEQPWPGRWVRLPDFWLPGDGNDARLALTEAYHRAPRPGVASRSPVEAAKAAPQPRWRALRSSAACRLAMRPPGSEPTTTPMPSRRPGSAGLCGASSRPTVRARSCRPTTGSPDGERTWSRSDRLALRRCCASRWSLSGQHETGATPSNEVYDCWLVLQSGGRPGLNQPQTVFDAVAGEGGA
jgi:hypothetical protein